MKHVKSLAQSLMVLAMILSQLPTVRAEPAVQPPSWLMYVSTDHGYAIQYPTTWHAQERVQPNHTNIASDVWFGEQIHVVTQVPSMPNAPSSKNATLVVLSQSTTAWRVELPNVIEYIVRTKAADFTLAFTARGDAAANQPVRDTFEAMARTFTLLPTRANQPTGALSAPRSPAKTSAIPNPPSNLRVLTPSVTTNSIPLLWDDASNDESGFFVWRWNGSSYAFIASVGANVTTYTDTGLQCGDYYSYVVTSYNVDGATWAPSMTWALDCIVQPPSNLRVLTSSATAGSITLAWEDNSSDELGFNVYRWANGSGGFLQAVGAGTITFTDTAAQCGEGYTYSVRAYKASGESSLNVVTFLAMDCVAPPTNLRVLTPVTLTSIPLAWDDNSSDETGFRIDQWDRSGWALQSSIYLGANVTSFTITGLQCGNTYNYRVVAYNALGDSAANPELRYLYYGSNHQLNGWPLDCLTPPSNLQVLSSSVTSSSIPLTWSDNSNNESGFRIYRWSGYLNSSFVGAVGAGVTTFTDTGLKCGTAYNYDVRSYNADGESADNPSLGFMGYATLPCPDPVAPSNLRVLTPGVTTSSIPIAWNDNSNDETGFRIYRGGVYIQSVGVGVTTFTDTGLQCSSNSPSYNLNYYYSVSAYNANGESLPNPMIPAMTANCVGPTAPTNLRVTSPIASRSIPFAWNDNSSNEQGFKIFRDDTYLQSVGAGVTTFTDTGLQCHTFYFYNIAAFNANGDSHLSNFIEPQTLPCGPTPPSNVRQVTASTTSSSIPILWDDNASDEAGFTVHMWDSRGEYTTTVGANVTTYTEPGLTCNSYHDFGVSAFNASGESPTWTYSLKTNPCTGPNPPANMAVGNSAHAPVIARAPMRPAYTNSITWGDSSSNETGFKIYRSTGGGYAPLVTLGANTTSFNDSTVACGATSSYRVSSYNASGESVYLLSVAAPSIPCSQQWNYLPFIRKH